MNTEMKQLAYISKIHEEDLLCPVCCFDSLSDRSNSLFCNNVACKKSTEPFYPVNNKPILIDFERSLVTSDGFLNNAGNSIVVRVESGFKKWIRGVFRGKRTITKANVCELIQRISAITNPKILVIGGGEIGAGLDELYSKFKENVLAFDIYDTEHIDFIADAHQIPVKNNYFDVVIIQAVLEHVLSPQKVVSEITRVLKYNGIVYAETPFIQHVHEGPFDFTRFTESGHRFLFRDYEIISSGNTAGAGSSLLWSLDFFFSGLFRTRTIGKFIRILLFWLRYFDNLIPTPYNIDAACGVYFMGAKSATPITNKQIVTHYKGNQVLGK